jgi:rod shape-determining protein MreB
LEVSVLLGALAMFSNDLAIDLGTANTCVFARGHGIVLNEPSIVALNTVNARVEAVGSEAKAMVGRTPGCITAIRPMRDGVIADFDAAEKMLDYFIKKAHGKRRFVRPRVVIGVPSGITQVERRAVRDSAHRARASEVYLVEEGMAAAIGAGLPITEACGNMIVDIGGGTTDICVISLAGIVYSRSLRVAGNAMDEAIANYVKREKDLLIGDRTAEQIKIELGSAAPLPERKELEVKGRHVVQGKPMTVTLNDQEVRGALEDPIRQIVQAVRNGLESTPPELAADLCDRGLVLSGGGALIRNLDERLRIETGVPVQIAADPLSSVVLGAGQMLSDINLLKKVSLD